MELDQSLPQGWQTLPVTHVPTVEPTVGSAAPRIALEMLVPFRSAAMADISDAVGPLYTMDAGMRPLYQPMSRLVGQALTVKAPPGDNMTIWGALELVEAGDVLIVDWRGFVGCGAGGGGLLVTPKLAGLAGVVVDGAWRDVSEVQALRLPLFGRGTHPFSSQKSQVGDINVPVCCGGVVVEAGDVVVADAEGIAIVPHAQVSAVASALEPHHIPASVEEWPIERRRRRAQMRADQYRVLRERRSHDHR